jgi:bifunctional non-homologous end joining protein LigD
MINSTEIKRQLPDEELLAFGYMTAKTPEASNVYTPGDPITKEMIIEYYHKVAEYIIPYLSGRPQYVKRSLAFDETIFLKEGDPGIPVLLNHLKGSLEEEKEMATLLCNNSSSLLYLVNKGLTEINPWHSSVDTPDYPDYMVIDLDPSDHNTFAQVKRVAKILKSVLDKAGAESFCKTSGATGIHVFIPIGTRYPYQIIKDFAFTICMLANKRIPEITSMDKKKAHKQHKIHLDYLQNKKGKSIASVYSVRDLPGAPVSTPVAWEELTDDLNPYDFNIFTVPERLKKSGDLYTGLLNGGTNILQCIQNLGSL